MTAARDMVSKIAVKNDLAALDCTTAAVFDLDSAAVDTEGRYAQGFIVSTERAITADDDISFAFTECDTSAGTYTAVPDGATLPSRKQSPNNTIVIAANSHKQVIGVFGTKRYVKVNLTGQMDTSDCEVTLTPIALADVQEFTGYDPTVVPSDGKP